MCSTNPLSFQGVDGTVVGATSHNVTQEGASGQTTNKYLLDFVKVNMAQWKQLEQCDISSQINLWGCHRIPEVNICIIFLFEKNKSWQKIAFLHYFETCL